MHCHDRGAAHRSASKLATARLLDDATATCSLGQVLELGAVDEQELYGALDWLIEDNRRASKRRWRDATCRTARWCSTTSARPISRAAPANWPSSGYNRDGKKGKLQIVFGLLCTAEGLPGRGRSVRRQCRRSLDAANQIAKLKQRFALERVVLVGDRGMITEARLSRPSNRPVSTSSPPCARRRSAASPRPAPFSFWKGGSAEMAIFARGVRMLATLR